MARTFRLLRHIQPLTPRLAWRAIDAGLRFRRAHGRVVRRARVLCGTADALDLSRPRDWRRRADRLYARAARDLQAVISPVSEIPVVTAAEPEPAVTRAYSLLRLAQAPYRRMALGAGALAAVTALVIAAVVLIGSGISRPFRARIFPRDLAERRSWFASSAIPPHARAGVGPSTEANGPFFHTEPSDHPWIEIDLGAPRTIRRLQISNRPDCCQTTGLPLTFQIFDESAAQWRAVTQRRAGFRVWNDEFPAARARRVRLQVAGSGILALQRIALFQW